MWKPANSLEWQREAVCALPKNREYIDWFFSKEEKGIILEDDCVPSQTFYYYCQELLDHYENNENVFSIGGCCFLEKKNLQEKYADSFSKNQSIKKESIKRK